MTGQRAPLVSWLLLERNGVSTRPDLDLDLDLGYPEPMSWVRFVVLGLGLVACGGRASSGKPNETGSPQGGSTGATRGTESSVGGAGSSSNASGGASTVLLVDDEAATDGRPGVPSSAAFFWGSPSSGWRLGNWFLTSDGVHDVELSPFVPARAGSSQARNVSGSGFEAGVVLWAELDHPLHRSVDLNAYDGISFWARLESKSGVLAVAVEDALQGALTPNSKEMLPMVVSFDVGPEWQQFTLPFEVLFLGEPFASSVAFFVGDGGEAFDLWIDDFAFSCAGRCR